jgi:hypothetical protein
MMAGGLVILAGTALATGWLRPPARAAAALDAAQDRGS